MKYIICSFIILFSSSCSKLRYKDLIEPEDAPNHILLRDVNIFNGSSETLLEKKDVLIFNQLIQGISDEIPLNPNYQVIDGSGKTLMPGLIDSHIHLSGSGAVPWANQPANEAYNLSAYLYAGITTVYDLGGISNDIRKLGEKVKSGEIPGPTVFNTHIPITVKNSHPIPLAKQMVPWPLSSLLNSLSPTIDDVNGADKLIENYISKDVDYVKIICDQIPPGSPEITFEQLKALIDAAHNRGKKVFVHVGSPKNATDAVMAGADILAHGIWRGRLSEEQADVIADAGIPVIYTISGFHNVAKIHHGEYQPNAADKHLVHDEILSPVTGDNGKSVHGQEVMNAFFEDVPRINPIGKTTSNYYTNEKYQSL